MSVVMDLYSRRIVGWSLKNNRTAALTKAALLKAIRNRHPPKGLIFHTDQGIEYRANDVLNIHKRYGFIPSMNRAYHCTDNAEMESFFHSFKGEFLRERSSEMSMICVMDWQDISSIFIIEFDGTSSLNYQSPVKYEAAV